jgi:hypothetical protein
VGAVRYQADGGGAWHRLEHPLLRPVHRGQRAEPRGGGRVPVLPRRQPAQRAGCPIVQRQAVPLADRVLPREPAARALRARRSARRVGLRAGHLGVPQLRGVRRPAGRAAAGFFLSSFIFLLYCLFSHILSRSGTSGCAATGSSRTMPPKT